MCKEKEKRRDKGVWREDKATWPQVRCHSMGCAIGVAEPLPCPVLLITARGIFAKKTCLIPLGLLLLPCLWRIFGCADPGIRCLQTICDGRCHVLYSSARAGFIALPFN